MDVKLLHGSRPKRIEHHGICVRIKMLWILRKVERILINCRVVGHFLDSSKAVCSRYEWLVAPWQIHPYHGAVCLNFAGRITVFPFEAVLDTIAEGIEPDAATIARHVSIRTSRDARLGFSFIYSQLADFVATEVRAIIIFNAIAIGHILVLDVITGAVTCLYNG